MDSIVNTNYRTTTTYHGDCAINPDVSATIDKKMNFIIPTVVMLTPSHQVIALRR